MTQIVWIASYPKSGNTWVRALVGNLIYGNLASSGDMMELIPDIHAAINASHLHGETTTFVKTHWMYHAKLPLREDTGGAIYVVRHPLDVIASNLNYYLLRQVDEYFAAPEERKAQVRKAYVDRFIDEGGDPDWRARGFGGWSDHVLSWLSKGVPFPRLPVRYEDLEADTNAFMNKLCQFCNIERSAEEIARAIEASSFARMRDMEEREIGAGTPGFFNAGAFDDSHAHGQRFMNQGKSGGYRELLTPDQQAAAAEKFKDVMQILGYQA